MKRRTVTFTRKDVSTPFFTDVTFVQHLTEAFVKTGKLEVTVVENQTRLKRSVTLAGEQAAFDQLKSDLSYKAFVQNRDSYNAIFGIKKSIGA